jgi:RNA polymerase sigma-70 factor (ECF subfamily)
MAELSPEQRLAMNLVFVCDLSYDDAARLTNTPLGTIRSRLNRARTNLRATMASYPS